MLVQNQAREGEGSAIPPEPQPTPSTSQPNISEPQTAPLQTETHPTVSHKPQTEAHIKQILPSPSTYQRKHKKTHKHRRAKKVTKLPQTSVPLDLGEDKAIHMEGGDSVERTITTDANLAPRNHIGGTDAQTRFKTASKKFRDPPLLEVNTFGSGKDRMEHLDDLTYFVPPTPYDSPLSGGHTPESDESIPNLLKLMNTCTELSNMVLALEEAQTTQDKVISRLKLRVRRLEKKRKARTSQPMKRRQFKGRVETSTDKSLGENASKQGRNDDKIEELNLTNEADTEVIIEDKGSGEKGGSTVDQVSTARPKVSAASVPVNVSVDTPSNPHTTTTIFGDEDLTIAQNLIKLRSKKAKVKGVAFRDMEEPPRLTRSTTTLQPLLTIDLKDKSKGVLVEEEPEKLEKVKRRDQGLAQIESNADLAQRIYEEELAELDRAIDADHELAIRMTHEEQEKYTIKERAKKRYPLIKEMLEKMLNWKAEAESTMAFELLKFIKSQVEE
uniref:Uncharacterized protein n=1 Tax=Tanacetum cinerariifolium TaxID=118510 RepID=A0A6L2LTK4_TANCI|nr:hypothetical protein [Tanacetum cinerariifolium]